MHCIYCLQGKTHVLSMLPLFASSTGSTGTESTKLLLEVVTASVSALRMMNTEGLTECVLGFLVNVHAEVREK